MKTYDITKNWRRLVRAGIVLTSITAQCASDCFAAWPETTRLKPASPLERKGAPALIEIDRQEWEADRLPSELDSPVFRELVRRWNGLPKTTHFVTTSRDGIPARVAVHEVGSGARVVVCVHGVFGQHTNWKYVAGALAGEYQLWLVDLPGCGKSDGPPPPKHARPGYCPAALADRVLQALEGRLSARPDVARILVAGHSLGGMVVLRMFTEDELRRCHGRVLDAVDGLVLFAPCDVVVTQATDTWRAMLGLNATKIRLGDATGLLQSAMDKSVRAGFCDTALATREMADEGVGLLRNGTQRRRAQDMLRNAIPWHSFGKAVNWDQVERLEARYQNIRVPCLIVWGHRDQTLTLAMGYKMKDEIPNARLAVVPRAMHLLPLECPEICADLVRQFEGQLRRGQLPAAHAVQTLKPGTAGNGMPASLATNSTARLRISSLPLEQRPSPDGHWF
jgi:pimeloyl-ACP methyl ester carboxylesterase